MKPKLVEALNKEVKTLRGQAEKIDESIKKDQTKTDRLWHEIGLIQDLLREMPKALPAPGKTTEGIGSGEPERDGKVPKKAKIDKELARNIWDHVSTTLTSKSAARAVADILGSAMLAGPVIMMAARLNWPNHGSAIIKMPPSTHRIMCVDCKVITRHKPCEWCGSICPEIDGLAPNPATR